MDKREIYNFAESATPDICSRLGLPRTADEALKLFKAAQTSMEKRKAFHAGLARKAVLSATQSAFRHLLHDKKQMKDFAFYQGWIYPQNTAASRLNDYVEDALRNTNNNGYNYLMVAALKRNIEDPAGTVLLGICQSPIHLWGWGYKGTEDGFSLYFTPKAEPKRWQRTYIPTP